MTQSEILRIRLGCQRLEGEPFGKPAEAVRALGAVQAQDYHGAKWALGLRTSGLSDADLDRAYSEGEILRTHVMRPTWHFVAPEDLRWMQELTAPRVLAGSRSFYARSGLDGKTLRRSNGILAKALRGGNHLTRPELASLLESEGVAQGDSLRLGLIIMRAELDAVVCSGALRGKRHTYALLDERAPRSRTRSRDEALGELATRYYSGHGPGTLEDFAWWSGLGGRDARAALSMIASRLVRETVSGREYFFEEPRTASRPSGAAHLLPNYDEFVVAFADRSGLFDARHLDKLDSRGNPLFMNTVVIDGRVEGTWRRTLKRETVDVEVSLFTTPGKAASAALSAAARRYGAFVGASLPKGTYNLAHSQGDTGQEE